MPMSFANGILLVDNYAVPDVLARLVLVLLVFVTVLVISSLIS